MKALAYTMLLSLAACGDDPPTLNTTAKLTVSSPSVTPYTIVTVTSDTPMSPVVNVTASGVSATAGLIDPSDLAVLVPPVLGSQALVVVANKVQLPAVPIEIVADPTVPTDAPAYFDAATNLALQELDALAAAAADASVTYDVYVAKKTIAVARHRFSALPNPTANVDPWKNPDEQAAAAAIVYENLRAAPNDLVSAVEALTPLVQVLTFGERPSALTAGALLVHWLVPFAQAAAVAATKDTPVFVSAMAPPIAATSGVPYPLAVTGTFRSVSPTDAMSESAAIAAIANAEATLPGLVGIVTSSAAEVYVAVPSFDSPTMATRPLPSRTLHVDPASLPSGVTLTSASDLSLTFDGPGTCTQLALRVVYDDGTNVPQTIAVGGTLDCS